MDTFYLQQFVNGLSTGMAYVILALGLTLVFGVLHVMNFAHGEFFMVGALVTYLAQAHFQQHYLAAALCGVLLTAAISYLVDLIAVRSIVLRRNGSGDSLLSTYAISLLLYEIVLQQMGPTPQAVEGIPGTFEAFGISLTYQRIFVLFMGSLMILAVHAGLRYSRFGKQVRALAQSRFAAEVVGVQVRRIGTQTFVIAALLAGAAGALMVPVITFSPTIGHGVITKIFAIVVIGGMGSVRGTLICGLGLGVLETFGSMAFSTTVSLAILYGVLILVLLFKPQGLFAKPV
jgi:branched-chain amino acid transport system permease protein